MPSIKTITFFFAVLLLFGVSYAENETLYNSSKGPVASTSTQLVDGQNNEVTGVIKEVGIYSFLMTDLSKKKEIKVKIDGLSYNPLDNKGIIKLEEGDRVKVYGVYDESFFFTDELHARWLITFDR